MAELRFKTRCDLLQGSAQLFIFCISAVEETRNVRRKEAYHPGNKAVFLK